MSRKSDDQVQREVRAEGWFMIVVILAWGVWWTYGTWGVIPW